MHTHLSAYCLKMMGIETWNTKPGFGIDTQYAIHPLYNTTGAPAGNLWLETGAIFPLAAWQMLDAMLAAVGFSRGVTEFCFASAPLLQIVMGTGLAQQLLATEDSLDTLREKNISYDQNEIPWLITYHPVDLLAEPANKAKAWEDLKRIKNMDTTP